MENGGGYRLVNGYLLIRSTLKTWYFQQLLAIGMGTKTPGLRAFKTSDHNWCFFSVAHKWPTLRSYPFKFASGYKIQKRNPLTDIGSSFTSVSKLENDLFGARALYSSARDNREPGAIPGRTRRCERGRKPPEPLYRLNPNETIREGAAVGRSASQKTCRKETCLGGDGKTPG